MKQDLIVAGPREMVKKGDCVEISAPIDEIKASQARDKVIAFNKQK